MALIRYKKEYNLLPLNETIFWDFSDGTSIQLRSGIDYLGYEEIPERSTILIYPREGNRGLGYTVLDSNLLGELEKKISSLGGVREIKN